MSDKVSNNRIRQFAKRVRQNGKKVSKSKNDDKVEIFGRPVKKRTIAIWSTILLSLSLAGSSAYKIWNDSTDGTNLSQEEKTEVITSIMKNTRINQNGKVVGIDVSESLSAEELEELLKREDAIPSTLYDEDGIAHDVSDLAGPIDFVILKMGARGYGLDGDIIDTGDSFMEQAMVCEKLGIPYGGYYYSTALTEEEALEEVEIVASLDQQLSEKLGGKPGHNLMSIAVDFEQRDDGRLSSNSNVTGIVAYWINKAEEKTGKKIILYSGGRDLTGPGQIVSIPDLNRNIKSGPVLIWTPGPRIPDGSRVHKDNQAQINKIVTTEGGNIGIIQAILDQKNADEGVTEWTDVDIMDADVFENLLRKNIGLQERSFSPGEIGDLDIVEAIENAYERIIKEDDDSKIEDVSKDDAIIIEGEIPLDSTEKIEEHEQAPQGFWSRIKNFFASLFQGGSKALELPESQSDTKVASVGKDNTFRSDLEVDNQEDEKYKSYDGEKNMPKSKERDGK